MGEKGLVGKLRLVLLSDPVSGIVEVHCMLKEHDLQHLLGLGMGELAPGNEVTNALGQHMDSLIGMLPNVREQFIPVCPEMLLSLDSCTHGI